MAARVAPQTVAPIARVGLGLELGAAGEVVGANVGVLLNPLPQPFGLVPAQVYGLKPNFYLTPGLAKALPEFLPGVSEQLQENARMANNGPPGISTEDEQKLNAALLNFSEQRLQQFLTDAQMGRRVLGIPASPFVTGALETRLAQIAAERKNTNTFGFYGPNQRIGPLAVGPNDIENNQIYNSTEPTKANNYSPGTNFYGVPLKDEIDKLVVPGSAPDNNFKPGGYEAIPDYRYENPIADHVARAAAKRQIAAAIPGLVSLSPLGLIGSANDPVEAALDAARRKKQTEQPRIEPTPDEIHGPPVGPGGAVIPGQGPADPPGATPGQATYSTDKVPPSGPFPDFFFMHKHGDP